MHTEVAFRMEIEIPSQKILSYIQTNNEQTEQLIAKGVQKAIDDVFKDQETFINIIAEKTKEQLFLVATRATNSWNVQAKISKALDEAVNNQIQKYAEALAKKMAESVEGLKG